MYFIKHQDCVSCKIFPDDIALVNTGKLIRKREDDINNNEPASAPTVDDKYWFKTMEALEEYLHQICGMSGVPLSYVVRNHIKPTAAVNNPPMDYSTPDKEIIARVPIVTVSDVGSD